MLHYSQNINQFFCLIITDTWLYLYVAMHPPFLQLSSTIEYISIDFIALVLKPPKMYMCCRSGEETAECILLASGIGFSCYQQPE